MRTAVAALAVVLGCSAALAQDLSTNFKVRTSEYRALHHGLPLCSAYTAITSGCAECCGRHALARNTSCQRELHTPMVALSAVRRYASGHLYEAQYIQVHEADVISG